MFFSKMHGLKNDFVVINNCILKIVFSKLLIQKLSNRYTGIGFDQFLLIEKSSDPLVDFHYRIFNANGEEVFQCGNGARCIAKFIQIKKLICKNKIVVSTNTTQMVLENINNQQVKVIMNAPLFHPHLVDLKVQLISDKYQVVINQNLIVTFRVAFLGNPHCVIIVNDVNNIDIETIGRALNNSSIFLHGVNVEFMEIINDTTIKIRVYERGVGETKSCGSGACAATAVGILNNMLKSQVLVKLLGGDLIVNWDKKLKFLHMIGPAEHVYDGYFNL
ncbi:Diaminopimelate epimerase [Buchnera aphidicola (Thelaxes suberi)]|uniref:diaminopimelate epimerase n=1 Tax=Buchnera aphidicola TaxID=9 RepID=UPI003464D312